MSFDDIMTACDQDMKVNKKFIEGQTIYKKGEQNTLVLQI